MSRRRSFLKQLFAGVGALNLPNVLRLQSQAADPDTANRRTSLIVLWQDGGPSHFETFDPKPLAPAEIRGALGAISTRHPGVNFCEVLPGLAAMADKFTIIRSICDAQPEHNAFQSYTGRNQRLPMPVGGWPTPGAVASKLLGPLHPSVPPYVSLCYTCTHGPYNEPSPGFLGVPHSPFRPLGPGRADLVLNGITHDRLGDRALLRKSLDRFRREADTTGMMDGHDAFTRQALGVLTSSRLANALDISQESEATRARYGKGNTKVMIDGNGAPRVPQSFLSARRLIEAGARIVTVNYSKWDWHGASYGTIFNRQREDHPVLDKALTALMEDLEQRGLLEDTLVGVWGEFGRTPKINKGVGRDHWPRVSFALLGGGSSNHGQVIGATDRLAGEPVARPVKFSELFATLYNHLGLDVSTATVADFQGRPHYLVADGSAPIRELL